MMRDARDIAVPSKVNGRPILAALHALASMSAGILFCFAMVHMASARDGSGVGFVGGVSSMIVFGWLGSTAVFLLTSALLKKPQFSLLALGLGVVAFGAALMTRSGFSLLDMQWKSACAEGNLDACYAQNSKVLRSAGTSSEARNAAVSNLRKACQGGQLLACGSLLAGDDLLLETCRDQASFCRKVDAARAANGFNRNVRKRPPRCPQQAARVAAAKGINRRQSRPPSVRARFGLDSAKRGGYGASVARDRRSGRVV